MAEPSEANPVSRKPSSSKKHKSKSGKSSHQHSGKSGHRERHQEHHEVSRQIALGQDENIQGQSETSGRMAEQLVGSYQEKLDKKRKSIPKAEAAAIKSAGNAWYQYQPLLGLQRSHPQPLPYLPL